jgi:lipopolysaccharide transport protein LptA/LPS export ABC transporter protein LptC
MPRQGLLTVARIKAARWIALAVAAALAVTLAVLWYLGRGAKVELTTAEGEPPRGAQQVGKGFDHTVTHEGKPLLRIRGKRDRYDREGNLHVEEVLITAYQEDGSRYEIAADVATYNLQDKEARLEGHVSLAGPDGFALRTKKLVLRQGGRWLDADSVVNFQWGTDPPLAGRAQKLQAQINRGEFVLAGGVGIRSMRAAQSTTTGEIGDEPFSMSAEVVIFQRTLHQLRADGKVLFKYADSNLKADRVAAHLSPQGNRLQFVRARWGVRSEFHDRDEAGRPGFLIAEGDSLAVLFDEAGKLPTRIELEGDGKVPGHLRRGIDSGEVFDLVSARAEGDLAQGRLTSAHADGGVTIVNEGPGVPGRRLTSRIANAEFAGSTLAQLEVTGDVRASESGRGDIVATRAVVTPDRTDAWGEPVRLDSPKGQVRAPHLTYTREGALAHAVGGVEATLPPGKENPMQETPLAEGGQPVQVTAEEAFLRDEPRTFLFKGKVRAWSGDRVLRADQLRGEAAQRQLAAAGSVQTVWFMPPGKAGGATTAGAGKPPGPRQVRVDADSLLYSDTEHQLVYDGNVRVVDGERTLRSKTLTVKLTEKGQARRMIAAGDVHLEAPSEGRTITAEQADYDVEARRVVFRGSPVTLQDQKGGSLNGKQAIYLMDTGKVKVSAEADEALQ